MLTVNGVELYVEAQGEGRPILGIHGTPSSAVLWEEAAQELAKHGRCITYDRRGFHRSASPTDYATLDLGEHVEDAAALLESMRARPAAVIGRSTGGLIALELARRHPDHVTALALLEPALFSIDPDATVWAESLRRLVLGTAESDPGGVSEAVVREALGDETWESLPGDLVELFAAASPAVLAETRGEGLDLSEHPLELTAQDLSAIRTPTLVVAAQDSPAPLRAVADRLTRALGRAEQVTVTGGHLINPAHPAVLEFLDRHL